MIKPMLQNLNCFPVALLITLGTLTTGQLYCQPALDFINQPEVTRILQTLSSDEMEGRKPFTPGIEKAAAFIAAEYQKAGLKPFAGKSFLQTFTVFRPVVKSGTAKSGQETVSPENIHALTDQSNVKVRLPSMDYKVVRIRKGDNPMSQYRAVSNSKQPMVLLMDTSHAAFFGRIKQFASSFMTGSATQIFVVTANPDAEEWQIDLEIQPNGAALSNVAAMLPGKTKPGEYVIFSGHYDHLGYGRPDKNKDSLYNGANDDASGTTAVLMLAKYFRQLGNNDRTVIFVAFTAEESGGYGSRYFSQQLDPASIVAMFNIEMIGTDSKWGTNSAFITGFELSSMGTMLQQNLTQTAFQFYPDPYPQQQLFYRSDNATLARLGVPAHTISTSKMDSEPHYHRPSDEIGTLDMKNMTEIIKAIALSSTSIVAGKDTPSRIEGNKLR